MTDQNTLNAGQFRDYIERFSGFADVYDRYRPAVPSIVVDILIRLAHVPRPALVVDIGCGTGLSTRIWSGRAEAVIGIEPNADMRAEAETRSIGLADIRYQDGYSTATHLPDGCADIVTVSQALHWMEPAGTFTEIARLLRPGGIFAAIDNDSPLVDWEVESTEQAFKSRCQRVAEQHGINKESKQHWPKMEHIQRMTTSGHFCYTRDMAVHSVETGDADRLVGLVMSQSNTQVLLKHGLSENEIGFPHFRDEVRRILGDEPRPFYFTYRIRIGVK